MRKAIQELIKVGEEHLERIKDLECDARAMGCEEDLLELAKRRREQMTAIRHGRWAISGATDEELAAVINANCPFCGNEQPCDFSSTDIDAGEAIQSVECGECPAVWDEIYELSRIRRTE